MPESVKAIRGLVSYEDAEGARASSKNIDFLQILGGLYLPHHGLGRAS